MLYEKPLLCKSMKQTSYLIPIPKLCLGRLVGLGIPHYPGGGTLAIRAAAPLELGGFSGPGLFCQFGGRRPAARPGSGLDRTRRGHVALCVGFTPLCSTSEDG